MGKNFNHFIIFRDQETYCSFPWAVFDKDKIVLVFRQASAFSAKAAKSGAVTHHDPNSWVMLAQSSDRGASWTTPVKIYQSETGVNDPAISATRNGLCVRVAEMDVKPSRLRNTLKGGSVVSHRPEHGLVAVARGNVVSFLDNDLRHIKETHVVACGDLTYSCSREPVLELADGTLLLSLYLGAPQKTDKSYILRSFDGGKTWGDPSCAFEDRNSGSSELQGINFNETSLLDLGNGEILAMARADISFEVADQYIQVGGVGSLYSAKSFNSGLSWTKPEPTKIFGQPAHLLLLDDKMGTVLCTYGYRKQPYGVRAVISHDRGKTWDTKNEIIIRDDGPMWDLGYPMTVKLPDGELLTVYYWNDAEGVRYIAGTRWSLNE